MYLSKIPNIMVTKDCVNRCCHFYVFLFTIKVDTVRVNKYSTVGGGEITTIKTYA